MESGGFFNAEQLSDGSYDMNYVAEQFAQYFALFVGNGIFVDDVNNLQASAAGNMNVKFNKGAAFWEGYWYINTEDLIKVVDLNLSASARIDSFVIRFDIAGRKNSIEYKKGDTTVQCADGIYELQLCTVRVDAGATSITDSNITDMRTDESVCGFVKGLLEVVKTDDLFKQFSDMFNTWFDNIRGVLDGDAAGNIVGMIGSLNDLQTTNKDNIVGAVNEVKTILDINQQNVDDIEEEIEYRLKSVIRYTQKTVETAIGLACDNELSEIIGNVFFELTTASGEYMVTSRRAENGLATGIVQKWDDGTTYSFRRLAGADAVLKKLGNVVATVIGTGGNGTYDATGIDGYEDFTVENFAFIPSLLKSGSNAQCTYAGGSTHGSTESVSNNASASPKLSYDAVKGKLTVSGCSCSNSDWNTHNRSDGMITVRSKSNASITGKIVCYHN